MPRRGWMPLLLIVALAALAFAFVACGDDDDGGANGTPGAEQPTDAPGGESQRRNELPEAGPDDAAVSADAATIVTGEEFPVEINLLAFPEPGLGAWTVDITYDPNVITIAACDAHEASVCNEAYDEDTVRLAGAVAEGLVGDILLATLTVHCEQEGTSDLAISLDVLADGTIGDPQERPANIEDGSVTCGPAGA